jgi:hypothetical protein
MSHMGFCLHTTKSTNGSLMYTAGHANKQALNMHQLQTAVFVLRVSAAINGSA